MLEGCLLLLSPMHVKPLALIVGSCGVPSLCGHFSQFEPDSLILSFQLSEAGTVLIPHGCHMGIRPNIACSVHTAVGSHLLHFSLQTPPRPQRATISYYSKTTQNLGAWARVGEIDVLSEALLPLQSPP